MEEEWHQLRLERARTQDLQCVAVQFTEDCVQVLVDGQTDRYTVEINQDAHMWDVGVSPNCTCQDHTWRNCVCKHIAFVLVLMGASDEFLIDCLWAEPSQDELYEWLYNAPSCVGGKIFLKEEDEEC